MPITRFARPLRRSGLQAGFFTSHQLTPSHLTHNSNTNQSGVRPISFSASSGAPADSSSRSSRPSTAKSNPAQSGAQPRSGSPSPTRKLSHSNHQRTTALGGTPKQVTPWASALLPHAGPGLVSFDGFFSLHRPLLELPVRFRSRKHTKQIQPAGLSHPQLSLGTAPLDEVAQAFETLEMGEADEFVEIVDLDDAGSPIGEAYMASVGGAGDESLRDVDATPESLIAQDAQLEAEHAHAQLEADAALGDEARFESPYDSHLIGEPDGQLYPPSVARYLAENQPFSIPSAPVASTSTLATAPVGTALALADGPTQANLSFLRPFSAPSQSVSPILTSVPMSASECTIQADKFLTSAHVHHLMGAHADAIDFVHEPLALAANFYSQPTGSSEASPSVPAYQPKLETPRQRGEVRVWSETKGWSIVDFSHVGAGSTSPFLPAEMVDLDWEDELAVGMMNLGQLGVAMERIQMDSVKRKRKKKITKHKYKKRRKAQRALRQRLGK